MKSFFSILLVLAAVVPGRAQLPTETAVSGIDKSIVRDGYRQVLAHDYDSREVFHPYFYESIKAVLGDTLPTGISVDSTVGQCLARLEAAGVVIHVMDKLQGRVLRVLVNAGVPLLLLGKDRHQHRGVTRVHGDVLYAYRGTDYNQSSRKEQGERIYTFKTVRGFAIEARELFAPGTQERSITDLQEIASQSELERLQYAVRALRDHRGESPLKQPPYDVFAYYCIVISPGKNLQDIKKTINDGLADVGFEYKLPEFRKLTASMLE